jgi:hypothetical protein
MSKKIFRPFVQSLMLAVIFSLFADAFADDKTEPPKPGPDGLESKACKLCGG